jgi:ribosomal protein S18 acetylase RimI-like enzyme
MIRKAKVGDYSLCLHLLTSLYHGDIGAGFKSVFESYVVGDNNAVLLARSEDGVIGILVGSYQMDIDWEGKTARIEAIIVDKKHRRAGIGEQLARCFILLAEKQKCKAVKSRVNRKNTRAQSFHESLGFVRADTYEYVLDFPSKLVGG